ncbi:fibrobacter succinogenes major paralogous domain-containing protein [Elizabethkingia miricola]|uniref:hypothetical protein n=1 Tax=Elizabethkingia miricola TaxID=172045 RepID=UPI003892C075
MNLVKRRVTGRIVLLILLWGVSCRGTASSENINEGIAPGNTAVTFRLHQAEFDGELSAVAGKKAPLPITSRTVKKEILMDPSTITTVEMTLTSTSTPVTFTDQKTAGLNPQAVIPGDNLQNGKKYRIIAYRKNNGSYHKHEDYTVGDPNPPEMLLSHGTEYEIVVYSFDSNALPTISTSEKTTINSANIAYSAGDINNGFLYQKIESFTPVYGGNSNTLDIVLRHKIAQITTKVNSAALANTTGVSNAIIGSHFTSGTIKLSDANIARSNQSTQSLSFVNPSVPSSEWTAAPAFVNSTGQISFSAQVTIGNVNKPINILTTDPQFAVKPGYKQTLTIKFGKQEKCGAYLGPNRTNWRDFMCYNLGVENVNASLVDPIDKTSHGAKYRYGAKTGEEGHYISQQDDQNSSYNVTFSGLFGSSKPNGAWKDTEKTENDPCPVGYRIPTGVEWQDVISYNSPITWGTWAGNSNTSNYYNAYLRVFYDNGARKLMLPIAGYRMRPLQSAGSGGLQARAFMGSYWSSSLVNGYPTVISLSLVNTSANNPGWVMMALSQQGFQGTAHAIRCISEK